MPEWHCDMRLSRPAPQMCLSSRMEISCQDTVMCFPLLLTAGAPDPLAPGGNFFFFFSNLKQKSKQHHLSQESAMAGNWCDRWHGSRLDHLVTVGPLPAPSPSHASRSFDQQLSICVWGGGECSGCGEGLGVNISISDSFHICVWLDPLQTHCMEAQTCYCFSKYASQDRPASKTLPLHQAPDNQVIHFC